jgi:hypothetical protein
MNHLHMSFNIEVGSHTILVENRSDLLRTRPVHFLIHPTGEYSAMLSTERHRNLHSFVCGLNGRVRTRQQYMTYPLPRHYLLDEQYHLSLIFEAVSIGKPFHSLPASVYLRDLYAGCLGHPSVVNPRQEFDNIVQEVFLRLDVGSWESLQLAYHAFFADEWLTGHCQVLGARDRAKYSVPGSVFPVLNDPLVVFKYSMCYHV